MLISIVIGFALLALSARHLGASRHSELILPRPYNNLYSDASGARDDSFI